MSERAQTIIQRLDAVRALHLKREFEQAWTFARTDAQREVLYTIYENILRVWEAKSA